MRSLLLLALMCPLAGCSVAVDTTPKPPPTSKALATGEMWPSMSAQSDGQTLKVYAAVLKGGDFVSLDDGDFFTATVSGQSIVLMREPYTDGKIHYFATFPAPIASADLVIDFHRTPGHVEAASSHVLIPAEFEITSPAPPSIKRGSMLTVAVQPPPVAKNDGTDQMTIAFYGDCLVDSNPHAIVFDEQGNATFDTSALILNKGTTGCGVGVQVRHETRGHADPAFNTPDTHPVEGLQARGYNTSLLP